MSNFTGLYVRITKIVTIFKVMMLLVLVSVVMNRPLNLLVVTKKV